MIICCSVQFSCSVMSDSLRPHGLQCTRLAGPSPTLGAYSNSCPLHQWWHPTISSSVIPFSFYFQSFPTQESFQMSQFFISGGQSIGVSASASVLPMNTQDWSLLGWTVWISLYSKGLSRVFSNTTVQKHQFFVIEDRLKEPGEWELRRRVPEVCRKEKDKAMAQEGNQLFHVFSRGTPSACTGAPNQHPGHRLHCHSVLSWRAGPPLLCSSRGPNTRGELNKQ